MAVKVVSQPVIGYLRTPALISPQTIINGRRKKRYTVADTASPMILGMADPQSFLGLGLLAN